MFIDFVTLKLICVAAAFTTIAGYLLFGLNDPTNEKSWAPVFGVLGGVLLLLGLHVIWVWPLPGPFNMAYGESCVLLGILLLAAGISIAKGYSLLPLAIPAFIFGLVSIVIAAGFIKLSLTPMPLINGFAFVLSGLGGVGAFLPLAFPERKIFRYLGALDMLAAAGIWAFTGYMAYYTHLASFAEYLPPGMK